MRHLLLLAPLAFSSLAFSQTNTKVAQTSGNCSPVITGGSSQVIIHCAGLSNEKANQMIKLMNGILARQIDMNDLDAQLGRIQQELASLNPIANAPPETKALIDQGYLAYTSCTTFMTDWMQRQTDGMQQRRTAEESQRTQQAQPYADTFNKSYLPKLVAMEAKYKSFADDGLPPPDHSHITNYHDAQMYLHYVQGLQQRALRGGRPQPGGAPSAIPGGYQSAIADNQTTMDVSHFLVSWIGASAPSSQPIPDMHVSDPSELAKYQTTLEPRLVAFRNKVQSLVPQYATNRSYDVTSFTQLNGVCMDIANLGSAYLRKITNNPDASISQLAPHTQADSTVPSFASPR